ncbi:MAG: acyl carrier protein [Lachnospiraceae bacterium]|nr:acyl carrier protein [Lachnospiraceae bacterium]
MEKEQIVKKVKEIIISSLDLKIQPEEIVGEDLINEVGINSIDALEIFVWIENEFDIEIEDEDLSDQLIASVDGLADYIIKRKM